MKAWMLSKPLDLKIADVPVPKPGPREILLRVQYCGICHTDLHEYKGEIPLPVLPIIPGHQIVGIVEEAGREVRKFCEGDRVGVPWLHGTCGDCDYCRAGRENLCDRAQFTGLHANGGFAEYHLVHEDFAHPLPKGVAAHELAPLLCGGVIGYRAYRHAGLSGKKGTLGLFGFGSSAHLLLQIARTEGHRVFVFSRSKEHQTLARSLGADWAGAAAAGRPPDLLDAGIVFAPKGALMIEGLKLLKKGGRMVSAGIHMDDIPSFSYNLLWEERTLTSVANSTRQDVTDLLAAAARIPLKIETEVFPFDKLPEALARLDQGLVQGSAVLQIA
jgi:propanol-preferring alcohol dehydrogenase